ncbi:PAS domain-containing protein [Roseateles sp. BYS78W]|uniref:PAS domain-containing protein n=1 Tax=Pelomonas candidula TaxID=3299025 RepID=A0ABW7H9Z7_9BURK
MTPASRLTWRFALLPALAAVALTAIMLGGGRRLLHEEITQRALARNQQHADLLAQQLQLSLRDAVGQVRLLARSPLLRPGASLPRVRAELDDLVERSPRFVWVGLVAPDGRVLAGSHGWLEGQSIAQRPVFRDGRDGMLGDVHEAVALTPLLPLAPGSSPELIDIGEPVIDDNGNVVGVVTAHLGLSWVREQLALSLGAAETATAEGLQGLVLTTLGGRSVVSGAAVPAGLPSGLGPPRTWRDADGRPWLLAQSTLRGSAGETPLLPWRAVVLQSEDSALAPLRGLTLSMLAIGIGAALLLGGAGFWASRRLLTPWDPLFDAVLTSPAADGAQVAERVQALVARRDRPTPAERLMGWLARDAGNLRRALDHLPVAIALADRQYRLEYLNPAFTRLLGWTGETTLGHPVVEPLLDTAGREAWARLLLQLQDEPGEFVARLDALTPGGARVAVQIHLVPMYDAPGRPVGALAVLHDLRGGRSDRPHGGTPAPAESTRDELARLSRHLLDQERLTSRKLAHTLHDELGQTIAALRLHWEAYRGGTGPREDLDARIASLVVLANRQVRGVLAELSPPLLGELGLAAALDNEVRQHRSGHGDDGIEALTELQVSDAAQLQRWPADVEYAAFMIAREALLNALRHAGARVIRLGLDGDDEWLELTIDDDGRGFLPGDSQVGLVGMRERALAVDAELHIDAQPGRGTMVALTWTPAGDEPHLSH